MMQMLYLSGAGIYEGKLKEVNNTYRARIFGSIPGVTTAYPAEPIDVRPLAAAKPDVVFISDPWHNFWDPCDTYPDCPSLYEGIEDLADAGGTAIVIESGDSQFYYEETLRLLSHIPRSGVAIRSETHRFRFESRNRPIFYLPHGTYKEMQHLPLEKNHDVLFSGSEHPDSYPVRARIATALRSTENNFNVDWLPHPSDSPHDVIGLHFWNRASFSRLGVAGTNAYKCLTMRYLELPAAGALAIGDVPSEAPCLEEHLVVVRDGMGPFEIRDAISDALHDPNYFERVRKAQEHVYAHHSFKDHAMRVCKEIEKELL